MYQRSNSRPSTRHRIIKNCNFCADHTQPNLRDIETLRRLVSERAKLQAHTRTGLCSTHQRMLTEVVKHARHLALLPFVA